MEKLNNGDIAEITYTTGGQQDSSLVYFHSYDEGVPCWVKYKSELTMSVRSTPHVHGWFNFKVLRKADADI